MSSREKNVRLAEKISRILGEKLTYLVKEEMKKCRKGDPTPPESLKLQIRGIVKFFVGKLIYRYYQRHKVKRPRTAFCFFMIDQYKMQKNSDQKEPLKIGTVGCRWKTLDLANRFYYFQLAEQDVVRYYKEVEYQQNEH